MSERTLAPFGRRSLPVTATRSLGGYAVVSAIDETGPQPDPGQFYMVATADGWGGATGRPFLPRALSVATAERSAAGVVLGFVVDNVGPGTARLMTAGDDDELVVAGPFGNGFSDPGDLAGARATPLLVAGGVGLPPLALLSSRLRARGIEPIVMAGFQSGERAAAAALFGCLALIATDDGTAAPGDGATAAGTGTVHHGPVTELLARHLEEEGDPVAVYACGPAPMLAAVRSLCATHGVAAELAMEAGMACGFGACFGCAVETEQGLVRLCLEGPVMNATEVLEWAP